MDSGKHCQLYINKRGRFLEEEATVNGGIREEEDEVEEEDSEEIIAMATGTMDEKRGKMDLGRNINRSIDRTRKNTGTIADIERTTSTGKPARGFYTEHSILDQRETTIDRMEGNSVDIIRIGTDSTIATDTGGTIDFYIFIG